MGFGFTHLTFCSKIITIYRNSTIGIPLGGSPCPLFPDCIGIWSVGVFAGEENQSTGKRALGARTRPNNKLNPHHVLKIGIQSHIRYWWANCFQYLEALSWRRTYETLRKIK